MTEVTLSEKQKVNTAILMLRHHLDEASYQEYFDWANQLLINDIFCHEIAMIASLEFDKNNIYFHEELADNLNGACKYLGLTEVYDSDEAYHQLTFLYCQQVLNQKMDVIKSLEEIHWIMYDYFAGYVNIWSLIFDKSTVEKYSTSFRHEVSKTMQKFMNHYNDNSVDFFMKINLLNRMVCIKA